MHILYNLTIDCVPVQIFERDHSLTVPHVLKELVEDVYGLKRCPFQDGDIAVDVGSNVGMVSILLAKKHPRIRIIAVEPQPANFQYLLKNIHLNQVSNITPVNKAVYSTSNQKLRMCAPQVNPGGASLYHKASAPGEWTDVTTISLDDLFQEHEIQKCRFLKMDAEGAEYDIFQNFRAFEKLEYLAIEFHENETLDKMGRSASELCSFLGKKLGPDKIRVANPLVDGRYDARCD